jgi:glutathione S-transferase
MITVHHLNESRSHRIVYYQRTPHTRLAPPELKDIHPLGKSPVITDDRGMVVAESGAIIDYIIRRYAGGRLQPAQDSPDYDVYVQWLHYAEGSAALPLVMKMTLDGLRFVLNHGRSAAPLERHVESEIANHMGYIDATLASRDYLLGDELTAADIQLSFIAEFATKLRQGGDYQHLLDWISRFQARPGYQRALARGDAQQASPT